MAKSFTRKKSNKVSTSPEVRQLTNLAADYIKHWTSQELGKIRYSERTICVPVNNGYKIGLYNLIVYPNKTCDVYNKNEEFVHRFESKISAILYTIYTIKNQLVLADEILMLDKEINKHYTDMINLRRIIEEARKRKDYVVVDSRQARLEIAEFHLNLARDKISKLHKHGKYNKVWE